LRHLLDTAAVDGRTFDGEAVAAVLGRDLLAVLRQLQKLARDQAILVPQDRGYRFAHALLREVVYREVAPDLRRELHRRLAEHLEARPGGADPERIGIHWEAAGVPQRAAPHLRAAAIEASRRGETSRFVDLLGRSGVSVQALTVESARPDWALLMRLARAMTTLGGRDREVEALYDVLQRVAIEDRDTLRQMYVVVRRGHWRYFGHGWGAEDEEDVRRAVALLPMGVDLGRGLYLLGVLEKFRGRLDEATRWLALADDAVRGLESSEAAMWRSSIVDQRASVALRAGRPDEAERLYAEAATLSERAGNVVNSCASDVNRVLAGIARGVIDGHEHRLEHAIHRLRLEQASWLAAHAMVVSAQLHVAHGNLSRALAVVTEASSVLGSSHNLPALAAVETERGHLHAVRGNVEEAERALERALGAAEGHGDTAGTAWVRAYRAQAAAFAGDHERAAEEALKAWHLVRDVVRTPNGTDVVLALLEGHVYGLDVAHILADLPPAQPTDAPSLGAARAWLAALRGKGPPHPSDLASAGEILRVTPFGLRRAVLRGVGAFLLATAVLARGDMEEGLRGAAAAREEADRLGHLPLRRACEHLLEKWCPDPARRRELLASAGPT
jgi:tetratricopeptide (TPR) repeat protein